MSKQKEKEVHLKKRINSKDFKNFFEEGVCFSEIEWNEWILSQIKIVLEEKK